jgi:hypothetical protein
MLIVVRRDDHKLAVINTDKLIQVVWLEADADYARWSVQMSHDRELHILTPAKVAATPTAAGVAITPDKLLTTLSGGLAAIKEADMSPSR